MRTLSYPFQTPYSTNSMLINEKLNKNAGNDKTLLKYARVLQNPANKNVFRDTSALQHI
jgi:hypothetical protein